MSDDGSIPFSATCPQCKRTLDSERSWKRHRSVGCAEHNVDRRRAQRTDTGKEVLIELEADDEQPSAAAAAAAAGLDDGSRAGFALQDPDPAIEMEADEGQDHAVAAVATAAAEVAMEATAATGATAARVGAGAAAGAGDGAEPPLMGGLHVGNRLDPLQEEPGAEDDGEPSDSSSDDESPLWAYLLHQFPDLDAGVVGDAVEELLEALREQHAGEESEDEEDLLEELLGLDILDAGNQQDPAADGRSSSSNSSVNAKPRSAEWFYNMRNEELYPGSKVIVLEQCFVLLGQKIKYKTKDTYVDELCRWNAETMPDGNLHPPSLHVMMKVLHCPEAEDFEQHVCPSECMCFPKLKRSEYKHHEHDECSMCGARRFTVRQLAGGRRLVPAKVFWYLGMAGTIKDHLFADPKWCDMRATARQTPHDFYSSAEAKRLDKMLGEQLSSPDNSAYELGFDFGQCFAFRQYSVGVLGFRCTDIPHSHRSKRPYCHVLAIIPGPKEPENLAPYLKPMLLELAELGPDGDGVLVTETKSDGTRRTFHHKVFIVGVFGDTPALKKLQAWLAHNAKLGCGWCIVRSTRDGNAQYWYGYSADTEIGWLTDAPPLRLAKCGADVTRLSHKQQERRALDVVEEVARPTEVGAHGISPLVGTKKLSNHNPLGLSYVDYNDLWIVPIGHAALLGLVKDFWKALLGPVKKGQPRPWYALPADSKAEIHRRAAELDSTDDFGRPYRCIVTERGSWVMENWLHWTESFSCLILAPSGGKHVLHDTRLHEMWGLLRDFLLHHMRMVDPYLSEADFREARHTARSNLERYAALAQDNFGRVLCKYNLHLLVCRLWQQQRKRGHTAFYSEFWVEGLVQLVKSSTKYRSTTQPELVIVGHLLLGRRLAVLKQEQGLKSFDEYFGAGGMQGVNMDEGIACQMLGSGKALGPSERAAAEAALARYVKDMTPEVWDEVMVAGAELLRYTYASQYVGLDTDAPHLLLKSVAYLRSVKRVSYYVRVRYAEPQGGQMREVQYVARIKYFLKATPNPAAGAQAAEPLRIAVADLFGAEVIEFGYGSLLRVRDMSRPKYPDYPVSLSLGHVDHKLLHMRHMMKQQQQGGREGMREEGWFVGYQNMSAML